MESRSPKRRRGSEGAVEEPETTLDDRDDAIEPEPNPEETRGMAISIGATIVILALGVWLGWRIATRPLPPLDYVRDAAPTAASPSELELDRLALELASSVAAQLVRLGPEIEFYRLRNGRFPESIVETPPAFETEPSEPAPPTFAIAAEPEAAAWPPDSLGGPMLDELVDPFAWYEGDFYRYLAIETPPDDLSGAEPGWLIWSAGPDGYYDLNWTQYKPGLKAPELAAILAVDSYDPTNGAISGGDIWAGRLHQEPGEAVIAEGNAGGAEAGAPPAPLTAEMEEEIRMRVSRARADQRSLAIALEAYHIDYLVYPDERRLSVLTSPIAYLSQLLLDPFGLGGEPYRYVSDRRREREGYIIWSAGPDGSYDLDDRLFDAGLSQDELTQILAPYTFDPTNGANSRGDIWRIAVPPR